MLNLKLLTKNKKHTKKSFFSFKNLFLTSHSEIVSIYLKTLASQRLVFEEKNESFLLENASNLTHKFLYGNFNKIILLKLSWFIFPQKRCAEERKCSLNITNYSEVKLNEYHIPTVDTSEM